MVLMLKSLIQPIKTNNGNTEIHNSALPELSELRSLAEPQIKESKKLNKI